MRKFPILLAVLLAVSGCAAPHSAPETTISAPVLQETTPAAQSETSVSQESPEDPEQTDAPEGGRYTYESLFANMSIELPEGWSCSIVPDGVGEPCFPAEEMTYAGEPTGEFGLVFYPDAEPELCFSLHYKVMGFGVCGTELTEEVVTLDSGMTAVIGTFYGFRHWSYVSFPDAAGCYVLEHVGTSNTWDSSREDINRILHSIRVGEGIISRTEAIEVAAELRGEDPADGWAEFDYMEGIWTVRFDSGDGDPTVRVRLDTRGNAVMDHVPDDWRR